jgi:predicted metal-dependent peptidase
MSDIGKSRKRKAWGDPKTKDPVARVMKARVQLAMDHPFWGFLVMRMPMYPLEGDNDWLDTAAVDAKGNLYFNKDFMATLTLPWTEFVLAHEVMHIVNRTIARMPVGCNHQVWNLAADQVGNTMLIDAGFECPDVLRKGVQTDEISDHIRGADPKGEHGHSTFMTIPQRYYELINEPPPECEACKQGIPFPGQGEGDGEEKSDQAGGNQDGNAGDAGDKDQDGASGGHSHGDGKPCDHKGSGSPSAGSPEHTCENWCHSGAAVDISQASPQDLHDWQQNIMAAAETCAGRGDLPGWMEDYLAEITKPTVTWKDKVRYIAQPIFRGKYHYHRPNRREDSIGCRMPRRKPMPKAAVITMDTSGSISDGFLNQSATETLGLMNQLGCEEVYVFFHDTNCYHYEKMTRKTVAKLKVTRAGTSHVHVFEKIDEVFKGKPPGVVICFTDLDTVFPSNKPSYEVIWAHPKGHGETHEIPWGHRVPVVLTGIDK